MAISFNSAMELRKPLKPCTKMYFSRRILDPYGIDGRFPFNYDITNIISQKCKRKNKGSVMKSANMKAQCHWVVTGALLANLIYLAFTFL